MRFTIKLQLGLAFGLIIALLLAATLFGINSLSSTNRDMNAMVDGPAAGLALLDALADAPELRGYHLLPAARAELLTRLDRTDEAAEAYAAALALVTNESERAQLRRRLSALA